MGKDLLVVSVLRPEEVMTNCVDIMLRKYIMWIIAAICLTACGTHPDVPQNCQQVDAWPQIYPDYIGVTVPANIAPLNFMSADSLATAIVARITAADGTALTYGKGCKVIIDEDDWQQMRDASCGSDLRVEVYVEQGEQGWKAYRPFSIHVAEAEVDRYVSYRLIDPSYVLYHSMRIAQRDVTTFDESEILNNRVTDGEGQGQCINCHSYQNYGTSNWLLHVRGRHGTTMMVVDGKPRAVNLRRNNTISAGVYPAWHPTQRLVAFSTDVTHQWFHTSDVNKIEVFDTASDLILYDIDKDEVTNIAADTARLEVFPTWSPDGQWLYYCSANVWRPDSTTVGDYRTNYVNVHYNVYRRQFSNGHFGPEEEVYRADTLGRSASLPRLSPDGRYLTFAEGSYGYFNIWHYDADVRIMRLADGQMIDATDTNSQEYADSYPSWSSNGCWLMFASRRDDGNYSRVMMAYFDGEHLGKAFVLPQRDPEHNLLRMQSYNRPEFMTEPVDTRGITEVLEAVGN